MMKYLSVLLLAGLTSGTAIAQTSGTTTVRKQNYLSDRPTTGVTDITPDSHTTSALNAQFSLERFEQRWKMEKEMYEKAGISGDKIDKLHDLNLKIWKARSRGEKIDFQELAKERSEVMTDEEMTKLRDTRRAMIKERLGQHDDRTSATQ